MTDPSRRFTTTVVSNAKRRVLVPLPFEPKESLPGLAFARSTSSFTDFAGSEGCVTRMCGVALTCDTGAKSRSALKLSFT